MATLFKYRAVTVVGDIREGTIAAQQIEQAEAHLQELQLRPIRIAPARSFGIASLFHLRPRIDYESLITLTSSLSSLYHAGIPMLRALAIIKVGKPGSPYNAALEQIRSSVQSGRELSAAMADFPDLFPSVFTASIQAGEESGRLDQTLDQLSSMLESEMELSRQIKAAVRYPMIVVGVIGIAFVTVMTFVVPRFVDFYGAFGAELPLPTKLLISTGLFFQHYWYLLVAGAVAGGLALHKFAATEAGRLWIDTKMARLPVVGELVIKGNVARFALLFRILFRSGLPLVKCLQVLSGTIRNAALVAEVREMEEMFQRGREGELVASRFQFFPQQALHMMAVGLESGSLDAMLGEIGTYYTKQVRYMSRQLTAVIEPILTLVLGVFVLVLALAIFLPMWNLIHVVGKQ